MTTEEKIALLIEAVSALEEAVTDISQNAEDAWGAWAQMRCSTALAILVKLKDSTE
jgi:hypothetical protein